MYLLGIFQVYLNLIVVTIAIEITAFLIVDTVVNIIYTKILDSKGNIL